MRAAGRFRVFLSACLSIVLALVLSVAGLGASPARAATPSLTMVAGSTYDVLPDEHRIAVTVEITATSNLRDTTTRRYTIDRAYLAVLPTASNFHLSGGTGTPKVTVSSRSAAATILLLRFGSPLGSGKSVKLTLTFDVVDPGGEPDRTLRISPSLLAFSAWAHGTDGVAGSSVRVRLPADYVATIGGGPLVGPSGETDGHVLYESGALPTPGLFVADIRADRPGVLLDERRLVLVAGEAVTLLIRSWPDDPAWRERVTDLLERGLPVLASGIGIAWPAAAEVEVRETIALADDGTAAGGGAASAFDQTSGQLDIPFTADPSAILHGAAHGWFNARLVADRWIAEGFASLYAEAAGVVLGVPVASPEMTDAALADAVPLNAWVFGGTSDAYGFAASVAAARSIREQAGDDALRQVWNDAARGIGAYQPIGTPDEGSDPSPEGGPESVDWRSLLDLLETKSDGSFEKVWRAWVVRPADARLLDARSDARALYDATVTAAAPWVLPRSIRDALRVWEFDLATKQLLEVADILQQRDEVALAAAAAGLVPSDAIRHAFEGTDGLEFAAAEAATQRAVIGAFDAVVAGRPTDPDPITTIGLIGTDPQRDLAAARTAFAAGDLDATVRLAESARATWAVATEVGRGRVVSGATIAIAIVLLLWLLVSRRGRTSGRNGRGRGGGAVRYTRRRSASGRREPADEHAESDGGSTAGGG